MKVIAVRPNRKAVVEEIGDSLETMQNFVGGLIQEIMPFEDDVALVCNDEGKLLHLELNRGLFSETGELYDIIAGNFFLAYAPPESDKFMSMPEDLLGKYLQKFYLPEQFFRTADRKIRAVKIDPAV